MASFGSVTSVVERPVGTTLQTAASAGDSALVVDDISRLTWPAGGLRIGTEQFDYTIDAAPDPAIDAIDADEDDEGADQVGTITLGTVLASAYDVDEPVVQFNQALVTERLATVMLPDQAEELVLRVPRHLWDRLPENIRERDAAPETVELQNHGGEWVMTDVVSEDPSVDASYIDISTLPTSRGPNGAGAGADLATVGDEAWTAPGNIKTSDDTYAHAIGTSATATVTAHNTGFTLPGTAANDATTGSLAWSNVNDIKVKNASPGSTTSALAGGTGNTQRLQATNFGFSVPVGATITGITVEVTRAGAAAGDVSDVIVKLLKAGSIVGTDKSSPATWPISFTSTTYGGDLWGTTWTPAQVNASDFGVSVQANIVSGNLALVDAIRLRVNYTTVSATGFRSNTHFLEATGFGFAIPDEANVLGITVEIERHASDNLDDDYAVDNQVKLTNGTDTSQDYGTSVHWPTTDAYATYGGDLWGLPWEGWQINDSSFGVLISANVNFDVTALVDHVRVTVSYGGLDGTTTSITGTVFLDVNVKEYGAVGDGSTDDRAAFQSAINAVNGYGRVYIPSGSYKLSSTGPLLLPTDATGIEIAGAGRDAVRIILSATVPAFLYFDRSADHDLFENVTVSDLTVDRNSVASEMCAAIGSVDDTRNPLQRVRFDNITVRRVNTVNVPVDRSLTTIDRNISFWTKHPSASPEGTQDYITNILVEDCHLEGGIAGVEACATSANTGTGTNVYLDNVTFRDCFHDCGSVPTTVTAGANFQIGSLAFGQKAEVENCIGIGSGDVGVEINAMAHAVVADCEIRESAGPSFFHTNYNDPAEPGEQSITFDNCHATRTQMASVTTGSFGFSASYQRSVELGRVHYKNCSYYRNITCEANITGEGLCINAPAKLIRVDGFDVTTLGNDYTTAANTECIGVAFLNGAHDNVDLHGLDVRMDGARSGSGTNKLKAMEVGGSTFSANRFVLHGMAISFATSGMSGQSVYGILFGHQVGTSVTMPTLEHVDIIGWTGSGAGWRGIYVGETTSLAITGKMIIADCSISLVSGGVGIDYLAPSNVANVVTRENY